jgi:hypothetical protein
MTDHPHLMPPQRWIVVATVAGVVAVLAAVAAVSHPFTLAADLVTAIPIVIGLLVLGLRVRRGQAPPVGTAAGQGETLPAIGRRWSLLWLGLAATVAAWEVYTYLGSPRSAHPTLSVLLDMLDATWSGKFVAFSLWVALGWYLVVQ